MGPVEKHWLPFGLNLSYQDGFQTGVEISYAYFEGYWYGLYVDSIYNFKQEYWKQSFGPELGFGFVGFDFGLLLSHKNNQTKTGLTARFMFSCIAAHAYLRLDYIFKSETALEAGIMLKFPTPLR